MADARPPSPNQQWLLRHGEALAKVVNRPHDPRFGPVFVRGQGSRLWDADGREFLDLTCGYSAANFGHAFAPLLAAARASLEQLGHLTGDPHPAKIQLAEELLQICGHRPSRGSGIGAPGKVLFNASGARAVESAWKAAVAFRPGKLLVLSPGFHGRSIATAAISATPRTGPLLDPSGYHVEPAESYPYCARCPQGLAWPTCQLACAARLFEFIQRQASGLSAVLVEPALGARGYIFPPAPFFQHLRALTRRAGVLMIADEIQTGLGRCGEWLLSRRQGWEADLVVLGKSLGGGIAPLSAVIGRAEILDAIPAGTESETFAATPLACNVALQVLGELRDGPWMARGIEVGERLRSWFTSHPDRAALGLHSVEGVGASCALEFASPHSPAQRPDGKRALGGLPPESNAAAQRRALRVAQAMFGAGLLVHASGPESTRIVLLPPLTISDVEQQATMQRLEMALKTCAESLCVAD